MADSTYKTFKDYQDKKKLNMVDTSFETDSISGGKNHKFWITPDYKIINLGSQWHWEWFLTNYKKYGISESELPIGDDRREQTVRLFALSKGFTRMNYSINGELLIVEAPSAYWGRKLRATIFDFITNNIQRINQLSISVLDSEGHSVKRGAFNWNIRGGTEQKMYDLSTILEKVVDINPDDLV